MSPFLLCAAILIFLYAGLSINVSRVRRRRRARPEITEAELTKAIRAHGNASEYVPLFVALFLYLQGVQAGPVLATVAGVATLSRVFHAAGMLRVADVGERHPLRVAGALGTYLCLFAFGGALLLRAL